MLRFFNQSRYITFSILVLFLVSEAFLRVVRSEKRVVHSYPRIYSFDSTLGYRGIPNVEGYIRRPSIEKHFRLNNYGFHASDFTAEHPDSIFRIILFGSSIIEGIWANQKKSIAVILDEKFKKAGYRVEVINCGISGASRGVQNIALVEELAGRFKPNLVLFEQSIPIVSGNYYRDMYEDYSILFSGSTPDQIQTSRLAAIKKVELVKKHRLISDFLDVCYCFRSICPEDDTYPAIPGTLHNFLETYYTNSSESWVYSKERKLDLNESIAYMNDFRERLRKANTSLVVFEYGDTWVESNHEVRLADISLDLPLAEARYCHQFDNHPNTAGYNLIADGIYRSLTAGYIPKDFAP